MTTQTATPQTDEWATSRSGRARIRLHSITTRASETGVEVYALDGHELLPRTKQFVGGNAEERARDYANTLWRAL